MVMMPLSRFSWLMMTLLFVVALTTGFDFGLTLVLMLFGYGFWTGWFLLYFRRKMREFEERERSVFVEITFQEAEALKYPACSKYSIFVLNTGRQEPEINFLCEPIDKGSAPKDVGPLVFMNHFAVPKADII